MRGGRRDLQNQREPPPQEREPDAGGERKWESELRLPEAVLLGQQNRCSVPDAAAAPQRWGVGRLEGSRTPCRAAHTGRPEGTHRDCRHPEAGFPALPPRPIPPRPGSTSPPPAPYPSRTPSRSGSPGYGTPRPFPPRPAVAQATKDAPAPCSRGAPAQPAVESRRGAQWGVLPWPRYAMPAPS